MKPTLKVDATKDYVENIYAELGIDMTVDDFIAKNALMAEYMMQNSNFDDVLKDYNVSIKFVVDNLQRGTFEEKNGTNMTMYESKVDEMVINNGGYIDFNDNFVYDHVKKKKTYNV